MTKNLTGLPERDTFLNTLVPHFGVTSLYRVASTPNITPNLQRTLLAIAKYPNLLRLRGRQTARLSVWCALSNLAAAICSRAKFSSPLSSV